MELEELQELVKGKMQGIARNVQKELPQGFGFVVLAFPFGENAKNEMMYVSNADRADIVASMKEFIEKTEQNFGNDTGKY